MAQYSLVVLTVPLNTDQTIWHFFAYMSINISVVSSLLTTHHELGTSAVCFMTGTTCRDCTRVML